MLLQWRTYLRYAQLPCVSRGSEVSLPVTPLLEHTLSCQIPRYIPAVRREEGAGLGQPIRPRTVRHGTKTGWHAPLAFRQPTFSSWGHTKSLCASRAVDATVVRLGSDSYKVVKSQVADGVS